MKIAFDLEYWQPTYQSAVLLLAAEQERIRRNDSFIDVVIVPGMHGGFGKFKNWPRTIAECVQCRDQILIPMLGLLPSVRNVELIDSRNIDVDWQHGRVFRMCHFMDAYSKGLRPFMTPTFRRINSSLITITLRECGKKHFETRDSNVDEWVLAARELERNGYEVIVVRDTEQARQNLKGVMTSPVASKCLHDRARLYEQAAVNLFVSNGPAWFALLMDVPVLMFRPTCETANKNSRAESLAAHGLPIGGQLPGAPSYQRMCWKEEKAKIIVNETKAFLCNQKK